MIGQTSTLYSNRSKQHVEQSEENNRKPGFSCQEVLKAKGSHQLDMSTTCEVTFKFNIHQLDVFNLQFFRETGD